MRDNKNERDRKINDGQEIRIRATIFVVILIAIIITLTLTSCKSRDESNDEKAKNVMELEINPVDYSKYSEIISEIDNLLEWVYQDGPKPNKNYVAQVDNLLELRDNQKLYMNDFLEDIEEFIRLYGDIGEEGDGQAVGDGQEDGWVDDRWDEGELPNWATEEYHKPGNDPYLKTNSKFIKTTDDGRDYILATDIAKENLGRADLMFTYKGTEYMLDKDTFKPTLLELKTKNHQYELTYLKEEINDDLEPIMWEEMLELVYTDRINGSAKTIEVYTKEDKITIISFEL